MFIRLKALMREMDVTEYDISKAIGKSYAYVSNRFTGMYDFTARDIGKICGMLEIPIEQCTEYFRESFITEG